ncbi:MAG: hypothetical protein H6672_19800 [Anaerolineaceae bacterium]|nr:hypothetical protein [Anaerolineaceae bacterium]
MDSTTQGLTILILLFTTVVSIVVTQFARRRRDLFLLRDIPAYATLPVMVGQAIEANRPVHVSWGSAGLGGVNTLLTLASAELFYQVAERASIGAASPILTVSDPIALPLGQDTLRRAYRSRGMLDRYQGSSVRWYPYGARSMAFAAALTATLGDDQVGMNTLVGSFGTELALIAEAAIRRNQPLIAASDQLEGQAVALVMSDHWLIGEEIFTAGAYLEGNPSHVASLVTQDVLRFLLILAILIPTALAVIDTIFNR